MEYDAFLSSSRTDLEAALRLRHYLQDAGLAVWADVGDAAIGEPWFNQVSRAMSASRAVLVLVGPSGVALPEPPGLEVVPSVSLDRAETPKLVITVLLPGAHPPDLPVFLRMLRYVDLRDWSSDQLEKLVAALRRRPRVFLCHAKEDEERIEALRDDFDANGIDAWYDKDELLPGVSWREEIYRAIETSDFFAICLSRRALEKTGFIHNEIRTAVEEYRRRPHGSVFLLPILLEKCDVPHIRLDATSRLDDLQWVEVFTGDLDALSRLVNGILRQWNVDLGFG